MAEAALWGFVAGSSLLLGALIALRLRPGRRVVGLLMAFGAGVLISAVAYDLVDEAFHVAHGSGAVGAGLAAGALAFYFGDRMIAPGAARTAKTQRLSTRRRPTGRSSSGPCSTASPRRS